MAMKILESEFSVAKPYARGVIAGDFVFLSGVGGIDPATDTVLGTMEGQADIKSYKELAAPILRKHLPVRASALIGVKELGRQGMILQVEVTALLSS